MSIEHKINAINDEMVRIRRDLHKIPEVGFAEYKTAAYISEYLKDLGFNVNDNVGGTGVIGLLEGKYPGKTIGLRACLDALEVTEKTGLEFASVHEGRMHACGHDGNMAMVLGAAKVLADYKDKMHGNVKFIFQPAEENTGGAAKIIAEGYLENPHVDVILTLHNWPGISERKVIIKEGAVLASSDLFTLEVIGTPGHGMWPHFAVDPVPITADIISAYQRIISREIDPLKPALISIGKIEGGSAANIIPDKITIYGTVRTFDIEVRKFIKERIGEIACNITKSARGSFNLQYEQVMPPAFNDFELTKKAVEILLSSENPVCVSDDYMPELGCEEFSLFQEKIPGLFIFIGNDSNDKNAPVVPIHTPHYDFNENILADGARTLCEITAGYVLV